MEFQADPATISLFTEKKLLISLGLSLFTWKRNIYQNKHFLKFSYYKYKTLQNKSSLLITENACVYQIT